jgi:hypothetical protein
MGEVVNLQYFLLGFTAYSPILQPLIPLKCFHENIKKIYLSFFQLGAIKKNQAAANPLLVSVIKLFTTAIYECS